MARKKNTSEAQSQQDSDAQQKRSGIIIPDSAKVKPSAGEVVQVSGKGKGKAPIQSDAKERTYLPFNRFPPLAFSDLGKRNFSDEDESGPLIVNLGIVGGTDVDVKKEEEKRKVAKEYVNNVEIPEMDRDVVEEVIVRFNRVSSGLEAENLVDDNFKVEVEKFLRAYFARANDQNPPSVPDRKFQPRQDQIIPFIREVWSEWLERGLLNKPVLKSHDRKAYEALMNWQRTNDMPDDLDVPAQKEANDRFLARGYFTMDEAQRVVGLLSRRDWN